MYCYLHAVAQNGTGPERAMAESRLLLEQRIQNGTMEVGESTNKTRLVERLGSGSFGDVYLGVTDSNTRVAVKVNYLVIIIIIIIIIIIGLIKDLCSAINKAAQVRCADKVSDNMFSIFHW